MGAVLRGRDTELGRDLAVEVLLEAGKDKPELIRRFVEEVQIGGQRQHPGVVAANDVGTFARRRMTRRAPDVVKWLRSTFLQPSFEQDTR